jgi:hypothetical protein
VNGQTTQAKRQSSGGVAVPSTLTPVVIVPSLIGSKLQAQLDGYRSEYARRHTLVWDIRPIGWSHET